MAGCDSVEAVREISFSKIRVVGQPIGGFLCATTFSQPPHTPRVEGGIFRYSHVNDFFLDSTKVRARFFDVKVPVSRWVANCNAILAAQLRPFGIYHPDIEALLAQPGWKREIA